MRKITLFLVIFLLSAISIDAQILNEILKRMKINKDALISLKADIHLIENPTLFDLDRLSTSNICLELPEYFNLVETTHGKLNYLSPIISKSENYYLRIDSVKQSEEIFIMKDGQHITYQPSLNQAFIGKVDTADISNLFTLLNMSRREILTKSHFTKMNNDIINGEEMWHLRLLPKIETNHKSIDFWVDGNGMINQLQIIEKNGDWKIISVSNLEKNIPIESSLFTLKLPNKTEIIKK